MLLKVAMLVATMGLTNAPSDAEVLRAMPRLERGVPFIFEQFRDDILIVKNMYSDVKVSETRFYPIIGQRRLVESKWECVVFYKERIQSDFPFPVKVEKNRVQVIYFDKAELVK
jgi:hypothetical protein